MGKNLFFLVVLIWAAQSMAKTPVVHQESVADSEGFRVEKPVKEKEGRFVAGEKKKHKHQKSEATEMTDPDSEVRYWQYQE